MFNFRQNVFVCVLLMSASTGFASPPASQQVLGAKQVLHQLAQNTPDKPKKHVSKPVAFLKQLQQYDAQVHTMPPQQAADAWLALAVASLGLAAEEWDAESFDLNTQEPVSFTSVLAVLPKPAVWSYFTLAKIPLAPQDAERQVQQLALRYLVAVLQGGQHSQAVLDELEAASVGVTSFNKSRLLQRVAQIKSDVTLDQGSTENILAQLERRIEAGSTLDTRSYAYGSLDIPDLVSMLGRVKATQWLTKALTTSNMPVLITHGELTLQLAQRIALDNIDDLKTAHWGLVSSLNAWQLYEAMQKKFPSAERNIGYEQRQARLYYFLGLVVHKQVDKAATVAQHLSREASRYALRKVLVQLQKQGFGTEVADYLHHILNQNPALNVWDMYIDIAVYNGHEDNIMRLIEAKLADPTLPDAVRHKVRLQQSKILLAVGQVEQGVAILLTHLAQGEADDRSAEQLVTIGRLFARQAWVDRGLSYLQTRVNAAKAEDKVLLTYVQQLSQQGEYKMAEAALIKAMMVTTKRLHALKAVFQMREVSVMDELAKKLGIELSGLYYRLQRWDDIVLLADQYAYWSAQDVAAFYAEKDTHNVPYALILAQALAASSKPQDQQRALQLVKQLLKQQPGYDPAYVLYLDLATTDVVSYLDVLYAQDQFEERPLIWKASVLFSRQQYQAALKVIKQAIAIDPSDGEQGPNDRMRAYAIYADILGVLGDTENQVLFEDAVKSIRLSETADQYRQAGLHRDAITRYQQASELFSGAYCIQSRLAIQLTKRGQFTLAAEHYRKAFELMPESFGRIESHCFGCESVFKDNRAQHIAESVFAKLLKNTQRKPQVPYMLGYLRMEQGRYQEAAEYFRQALSIDGQYLSAWKQLYRMHKKTYIPKWELNLAVSKLLALDPLERHVKVNVERVTDLSMLWNRANTAYQLGAYQVDSLYGLAASQRYRKQKESSEVDKHPMTKLLRLFKQQSIRRKVSHNKPGMVLFKTLWVKNIVALIHPVDDAVY